MNDHNINIENEQWVNNLLNNNSKHLPEEKKNPVEQDPESRKHTKQKTSLRDEVETRTHNNSSDYSMV